MERVLGRAIDEEHGESEDVIKTEMVGGGGGKYGAKRRGAMSVQRSNGSRAKP